MSGELVLSLFPGIGLFDRAFEEEGFTVVRGPDVLWGGDVRRFSSPAGVFDGVIGGPPCQPFSRLVHMVRANGYEPRHHNLIPEFERIVAEADPSWFVMEEVPEAPKPHVQGYAVVQVKLNNRWIGGEQDRCRVFSFGTTNGTMLHPDVAIFESQRWAPAVTASTGGGKINRKKDQRFSEALRLQGLPPDFLSEAPFTATGKHHVVGNGVPLPLGRAIARAVRRAMGLPLLDHAEAGEVA